MLHYCNQAADDPGYRKIDFDFGMKVQAGIMSTSDANFIKIFESITGLGTAGHAERSP